MRTWILLLALIWTQKFCFSPLHVIQFLNQLPMERALEAKIIPDPKSGFTVFYRIEKNIKVAEDPI